MGVAALGFVLVAGALLRGWLVPASRGDLSPEAYGWRLKGPWAPKAEVTVSFPTPDGGAWVAVRRSVPEATPLAALRELAAGPAPQSGLNPALPGTLQVASVVVGDGVATVHVEGWDPDPSDPVVPAALDAMARTLAGTKVAVVTASGRTLGPAAESGAPGRVTYLWRGLPVPTPADLPAGSERPAAAVRRLLSGPPPAGVDPMPDGVSLLNVAVKGDLAKVSLGLSPGVTQELVAGRWQFAPHAMAILYTLTDLPGIRRVQFDFPTLPPEARRNCRTPLGVPLVRPDAESSRAKGV